MPCRRCGVCCTRYQASVRPEDIRRINAFLGITEAEWNQRYDDPRWEYNDYRLIRQVDGACAFLEYDGDLAACAIYPVRPACCADWQPGEGKKECREGEKHAIRKARRRAEIKTSGKVKHGN
jgi:Fe-S-cluster containining protein